MTEQADNKFPEVRFKGYCDGWEEKPLGEIYAKIRNAFVGTATPYYTDKGYFYLQSNNVKDGVINRKTEVFINEEFHQKQRDNWLKTNDIVMVQSGHVGHTAVIPNELNDTSAHALIIISRPSLDTCSYYLNFCFQGDRAKRGLSDITTGNTIKHILASEIKRFGVFFPSSTEQTKIGSYFKELDRMIGLHQRKHEKLVTLKQAMLQKMFPQDGATTPEIRFKGFEEDWSEMPFKMITSRVTQFSSEENLPRLEYEDIISGAGCLNKNLFRKKSHKKGIKFEVGDVLFGKLRPYLENWLLASFEGIAVGDFWVLRSPTTEPEFLYSFIQTNRFGIITNQSAGSKMPRSDWSLVSNSIFLLPSNNAEQQKIGTYFRKLDELISKHSTQLKKLKNIKSACLEKMFI